LGEDFPVELLGFLQSTGLVMAAGLLEGLLEGGLGHGA
jgi:hypothetical protein